MYFVYVDESGTTGPDPVQRFFVLAALVASMERCLQVQEQLVKLKLQFFPAIDSMATSIRSHLRDARLVSIHREYLQSMRKGGDTSRLVEYPVFVQSQFFAAVQLADVCAYHLFHSFQLKPQARALAELNPAGEEGLEVILKMLERSSGLERIP